MSDFAIGVDLGGTSLRVAVVEDKGTLLEKLTLSTKVLRGPERVVAAMCDSIAALQTRYKSNGKMMGIGVGVPGIIDLHTGVLRESPNLPGWHDYPVLQEIEHRLGTRVILENDANVGAMGEYWLGAGRGYDSMFMYTLGTGIGGGIVFEGAIWHGMTGMAGEPGHTTIEPKGPPCACGNRGCLEQFAGATAVIRMAKEAIAEGHAPKLKREVDNGQELNPQLVYKLATQGDKASRAIYRTVGEALGISVASMINVLNLPIFVIGGGVAGAWEAFSPYIFEEVRKRSFVYNATAPPEGERIAPGCTHITHALLGADSGLYGAARLPMLPEERKAHSTNARSSSRAL
jgi:glucokinase